MFSISYFCFWSGLIDGDRVLSSEPMNLQLLRGINDKYRLNLERNRGILPNSRLRDHVHPNLITLYIMIP